MATHALWNLLQQLKSDYEWVELSHRLNNDSPYWSGMPEGSVEIGKTVFDWGNPMLECLIQTFKFPGQFGTHIDFPGHFAKGTALSDSFGVQHMAYAIGISVFMIAFVNAIGLPSIPFLTVNGIIFGLIPGIIISWIGEVIGIEISFRLTRTLLRKQAQNVISKSKMLEKLDSYSCIKTVMMGRAIPYAPNVVVTAFSALSHISYRDHFIANFFGKMPAVLVEVWLGHDLLRIQEHWGRLLILVAVV